MSAPRALAELVVNSVRIFGKAMAAAGRQAAANARYKPEAQDTHSPGSSGAKNKLTSDLQMSLDEAHLILNVKKDAKLDEIVASYERIFKANSPPEPPKDAKDAPAGSPEAAAAARAARQAKSKKQNKQITHSHYLQSKVYRALERIQAERVEEAGPEEAAAAEAAAAEGAPAATGEAAEGATQAPPPPGESKGSGKA